MKREHDNVACATDMAGYTWTSLSDYLRWVETYLRLKEFRVEEVYSYRYTSSGPRGLLSKKIKLEATVKSNREAIRAHMITCQDRHKRVVLNSLVRNYDALLNILMEQITSLEIATEVAQSSIEYVDIETDEDVIPF